MTTPDTVSTATLATDTMTTPDTVSTATPAAVTMATLAVSPTEMVSPALTASGSGQEQMDNALSDLSELQVRPDGARVDTLVRPGCWV